MQNDIELILTDRTSAQRPRRMLSRAGTFAASVVVFLSGCDAQQEGDAQPKQMPLVSESEHFRFHYEPGDSVAAAYTEAHYAWATAQLGVVPPRKVDYYKYRSHQQMGQYTGHYDWNAFAVPEQFEIHTLWAWDNHETVHIYSSLIGRPSEFFNEGIAVALQTNPHDRQYDSVFNGVPVHAWAKQRLEDGTLLSLDGIVASDAFRSIADSTFSYGEAGSFVRYLIDTYGMLPFAEFMRRSTRDDSLDVIRSRFAEAFAQPLGDSASGWHVFLQNLPVSTPQP
jgi:hypothetical protein